MLNIFYKKVSELWYLNISDARLKDIIFKSGPSADSIKRLRNLNVYTYQFSAEKIIKMKKKKLDKNAERYYQQELKQRLKANKNGVKGKLKIIGELKKEVKKYKQFELNQIKEEAMNMSRRVHVGVLAQEMQKVFSNSVSYDEDGYMYISSTEELFYAMLNAIKSLDLLYTLLEKQVFKNTSDILRLKRENEDLKRQNENILRRLEVLERKIK